jgi:DNA-binding response OmpR family regulator
MTCVRCDALAAENARLRDEVEAWRANERHADREAFIVERMDRWRSVLSPLTYRHLMVLLALVDGPGRIVSGERLAFLTTQSPFARLEDPHPHAVQVAICQTRRVLRAVGLRGDLPAACKAPDAGIVNHRGRGYSMSAEVAASLRRLAGEAVDG